MLVEPFMKVNYLGNREAHLTGGMVGGLGMGWN